MFSIVRYRSRADFGKDDFRLTLPRFSEENFAKNLTLVDGINAIAEKYKASNSQVTLAWILASHPSCTFSLLFSLFSTHLCIPSSRPHPRISLKRPSRGKRKGCAPSALSRGRAGDSQALRGGGGARRALPGGALGFDPGRMLAA